MGGSSYIKLPKCIEYKKAVVNVVNQDQYCFAWAITSALFPAVSMQAQLGSYPHYASVLNLTGMDFPVKLCDISKFEKLNNISVNVYGIESSFENNKLKYEIVGPLRYATKKLNKHINLLLITEDCDIKDDNEHTCDMNCSKSHYCWISDLSRLVSSQISKDHAKLYFCDGCLIYFKSQSSLILHQSHDCKHTYSLTPSEGLKVDKFGKSVPENILKFDSIEKQMRVPFVVYADFESVLKPVETVEPNPQNSYTLKSLKHEPYSFAYFIKCSFDDSISKFELYRGNDAAKVFVERIETDLRLLYNTYLKDIKAMKPLTADQREEFKVAQTCGICERPFEDNDVKVKDHCHITGEKRYGAAHSICNLNYQLPSFVPIIFHNLSGYDSHLFIKELCKHGDKIDVIAQSKEKYISFTKSIYMHDYVDRKTGSLKRKYLKLRFIDSFKFLAASLENLGNGLSTHELKETRKNFVNESQFNLMRKKGVFPYSFIDSMEKMNNPTLPTKNQFYDHLREEHISDESYERAKDVWRLFDCKNLGDYADLYLKSDVLLLTDVFEQFRDTCLKVYKLDPAHYYTLPSLSFDCMLRMSKVELELLTDIDMIHFFKKGIRGGISQCTERKHIANNSYLPNYDETKPTSFITYLDATNLYGHSMSQALPYGSFEWLSERDIIDLNIMDVDDDSPQGYVLEVDVHYPEDLQDVHSELPFLVENIVPPTENAKLTKLIPNLNDKIKYVVHYRTLKQAINNGLMVMRTHRILKFDQSNWLKKYVDFNTEMRNKSTSKFGKDLFKLFINANFGKSMENVEKRKDIKLITQWENSTGKVGARALISRPNFNSRSIFSEDFVAIHMDRLKILYNKPIYIGFSILDISKTVMYDFFYNFIKNKFGNNASLLYTDTDSLILKVYTDNFYSCIAENPDKFDTSNYPEANKFNIVKSISVPGKMKDEFPGDPIISFYGTGAKAYYVKSIQNELKKAKGIKKSVIEKELHLEDYQKIVENGGLIFRKMKTFRSDLHDVYTEIIKKVALSHNDNKRYVIPSSTKTLPWGHSDIQFYETPAEDNLKNLLQVMESFL
ncbi:MAG: hypothetical protein ACRDV0_10690 [Acidimicrobiales bacterium]